MSSLMRISPFLSRWPNIWDDEDFSSLMPGVNTAGNNLEVYETKDEVVVKANVAGINTDDVDITFEKGVLFIQAAHKVEQKDENKRYFSRLSTSYSYKVAVPGDIDHSAEPSAEVDNGIITITFKKAEQAKPKKLTITKKS